MIKMKKSLLRFSSLLSLTLFINTAWADKYSDTRKLFQNAGQSSDFFNNNFGYALFPTIGKGGFGIGGAHGSGRVYQQGKFIGDSTMTQLSIGFQAGGQAFSQVIFFQDERALKEFTSNNFEFGAQASAVAITAGAQASASTAGTSAGASGGKNNANTAGKYSGGMAIFTIAKGGLMYEASIGGQKFSYKAK
jgi:lipid-binding SYLF domain-containing protein